MIRILNMILGRVLGFIPSPLSSQIRFEFFSWVGRLLSRDLFLCAESPHYLNLGCGDVPLADFINIDFYTGRWQDYGADFRYPLKVADNSVDGIFCEHTLEHLAYIHAAQLMRECARVLKPGGIMRIAVPDIGMFCQHYCDGDGEWFGQWESLMFSESADPERRKRRLVSPLEALSFVTQEYGHLSCWDFETLDVYLKNCGFSVRALRSFREGDDARLLQDLNNEDRKFVSVYVEAVK